jgi:hypothetical protein
MSKLLTRSCRLPGGGPGLARECGAGFLFHRDVPGDAGSYRPSTGVYPLRPTGGELEQVSCGVEALTAAGLAIEAIREPLKTSRGKNTMPFLHLLARPSTP